MDSQKIILVGLILIAIGIGLFVHFSRPLWVEPDSAAFFNRSCLNGKDFNTPILSRQVFDLIPCNEIAWKIFHVLLVLAGISSLYYFCKVLNLGDNWFYFSFLSYFLLSFLLNIEDDQLVFPLIVGLSARLLANPTWSKRLGYSLCLVGITLFVWNGAFVPMGIVLGYTIHPLIAILLPLGYIGYQYIQSGNFFFNDPGNTQELIPGYGFLTNDIPLLLLLFVKDKKKKILENKALFGLFTGFNILAFVYPKLAYYSVIPFLLIGSKFFDEQQKQTLILGGMIAILLAPSLILWNMEPNQQSWKVIDSAVLLQMQGKIVYNEWWVGRWFYYRGGNPNQEGGSVGKLTTNELDYYYLGTTKQGCQTIERAGRLRLQHCVFLEPTFI